MLQKLFKSNKHFFVFGFLIGAIIFLSSFLVAGYVLAVDDNSVVGVCGPLICDSDQAVCESVVGSTAWQVDGYPNGAGNPQCCGDDSLEYVVTHITQGWTMCCDDSTDKPARCYASGLGGAVCDNTTISCIDNYIEGHCVYNQQDMTGLYNLDGLDDDEYCLENVSNNTGYGTWIDQDEQSVGCQSTWLSGVSACDNAGPNGTCDDSDNDPSNGFCCGDDANEFISLSLNDNSTTLCCGGITEKVGVCVSTNGATCPLGDPIFCYEDTYNSDTDCIFNGLRYMLDETVDIDSDGDAEFCYEGSNPVNSYEGLWIDPDESDVYFGSDFACSNFKNPNYYWMINSNTCDNAGPGGICDDADGGAFCCGDDPNENYISTDCDGNAVSLCCPDDKPYVKNGSCVTSCGCGDNALSGTEGDLDQANCSGYGWALTDGQSPSTCWQSGRDDPYLCCGDDSSEYVIGECDPLFDLTCNSVWLCCPNSNDCVLENGSGCTAYGETDSAFGLKEFTVLCHGGSNWDDCDNYYGECGDAICGSASGVYAGESSVGEYTDTITLECCGDDSNEYYAELCPGVAGVERKCCNDSGDKIDQDGNCVSSCPAINQAPTISLSSPSNGATCINEGGVTLTWDGNDPDSGPNPLEYHLYISTDQNAVSNFEASAYWATVTSESYDYADPLGYDTTYYWAVIADDGDLQTASEVWSFTTQVCDPNQACCQADGCSFIGDGGQPRGYTDVYSCDGDPDCGGSCDIQVVDYYCQDSDSAVYQTSGPIGTTCDACEQWDGASGCNLCVGSECSINFPCSTFQCDLYDPDGTGPVGEQAYYQTREVNCNSCSCLPWGAYDTCENSYNNCTGANQVECYQGIGCNIANNACYCETGYIPDPDNPGYCVSDGTYPVVDFDWCLSTQVNTVQFTSTVSGGSGVYTSYEWDFGDGSCSGPSPATECDDINPIHTYSTTASYEVSLIVTDSDSHQGQKIHTVDLSTAPDCSTSFNFNSVTSQSSTSLVLDWEYSKGNPNYEIYRDGSQISGAAYVCGSDTCTYTDTGLQPGTQYSYYILAQPSGTYNSTLDPLCDGATASPPDYCSLTATTRSDVGGLNVYSDSCGKIKIQWDDLGEDYTYYIYRGLDSAEAITVSDLLTDISRSYCSNGTCIYEDSSIIPEKIYYYKITSYSTATGESSLDDAGSGSAFSYCYRAPIWGEM